MAKTRHEIINDLYKSGWLRQTVKNICGENQRFCDDLLQEITLILLEYKNDKLIIGLHEVDKLKFFIVRVIMTQIRGTHSEFFAKYRKYELNTISLNEKIN